MQYEPGDRLVMQKTPSRQWTFLVYRGEQCLGPYNRGGYSRRDAESARDGFRRAGFQVDDSAFTG